MTILSLIFLTIHGMFYLLMFSKLVGYKDEDQNSESANISMVICYKNEEINVEKYLPKILDQEYAELILVNDNSSDKTLDCLKRYESEKVKVVSITEDYPGKKFALYKGIEAARYNRILLTDADCAPFSDDWSSRMSSINTSFVLGYGPMQKIGGIVPLFSRYETYLVAIQYFSYALAGMPYMGVGRNLIMDKSLYESEKSKIKAAHLASGDDDLMINALANKTNTSICIDPKTFMYSPPKTGLIEFLNQKSRHISTSVYYQWKHKVLLGLFSISQIGFYLTCIVGILLTEISVLQGLLLLVLKWGIQQAINFNLMKKLKEEDLFYKMPILDALFFVYLLILPFYSILNQNRSRWT